jgi:hypothetical protein
VQEEEQEQEQDGEQLLRRRMGLEVVGGEAGGAKGEGEVGGQSAGEGSGLTGFEELLLGWTSQPQMGKRKLIIVVKAGQQRWWPFPLSQLRLQLEQQPTCSSASRDPLNIRIVIEHRIILLRPGAGASPSRTVQVRRVAWRRGRKRKRTITLIQMMRRTTRRRKAERLTMKTTAMAMMMKRTMIVAVTTAPNRNTSDSAKEVVTGLVTFPTAIAITDKSSIGHVHQQVQVSALPPLIHRLCVLRTQRLLLRRSSAESRDKQQRCNLREKAALWQRPKTLFCEKLWSWTTGISPAWRSWRRTRRRRRRRRREVF